ncbi:hypothetical protein MUK42_06376 [Musa troglodytarum]|uniref:Uncharacterized protein n=1 Tax=Musa troglodytarum TaxID=320322 RepID=A0A9E7HJE2_9LILI|nr:hypothetical protein MUK42_06376 [Musa troglodytarum]
MQQTPADRRSTYLAALTQEIERKLQKALISPGQRPELLQKLFADVALEIDDRARDILLKKDENEIASADDGTENLCFYDLFEASVETSEVLLRYGSALVQGASNYLLEEVALVPNRSNKISLQARRDLYLLLSRSRIENGDEYKAEGMPVQLHFPRRAYVSNKSCTSCSLGYIGSSLPGEWSFGDCNQLLGLIGVIVKHGQGWDI